MPADEIRLPPCRSTLLSALRACMSAAGDERDLAEVAGLTGMAFHLNVDARVSPTSAAAYPWVQELPGMVARLGYELDLVYADDEDPQFDRKQEDAARVAAEAVTNERPALLFGVHLPEFGLVRAFDPERRELHVSGVLDDRGGLPTLPIDRLGRGDVPVLLLAALRSGRAELDATEARLAAVRHAVRHARNLGPRLGGFTCGLDAYDTWLAALDSGALDPAGHAYTLQIVAELRAGAAPFLDRIGGAGGEAFADAARCYRRAADRLIELAAATPFPLPDDFALTSTLRGAAIDALRAAADAERGGVEQLERGLDAARRARATASLRVDDATPDDAGELFRYTDEMPLADLPAAAAELRGRLRPAIGDAVRAKLARAGDQVVGLALYADLERAGAAVDVAEPEHYLYLYYVWVARDRRRAGIGRALVDALVAEARERDRVGVLADATDQEIYLHAEGFAALGFDTVDRGENGASLMYLAVTRERPNASIAAPAPAPDGPLPVVVAQGRPCPLLALTRANVVAAAERARARGAEIDLQLRDEPPHEILVGGRRLPLTYIPADAVEMALLGAAEAWARRDR